MHVSRDEIMNCGIPLTGCRIVAGECGVRNQLNRLKDSTSTV